MALSYQDKQRRAEARRLAHGRVPKRETPASTRPPAVDDATLARIASTPNPALSKKSRKALENQLAREAAAKAAAAKAPIEIARSA